MLSSDLEERLINFVGMVNAITGEMTRYELSNILTSQILRSSSSCVLNFAEAESSFTNKDFVYKLNLVQKELRETKINLRTIKKLRLCNNMELLNRAIDENDQLLAIIYTSIKTMNSRLKDKK